MLPPTSVGIKHAFHEIKHFCIDAWEGDYRPAARQALTQIVETRMHTAVDEHLEQRRTQDIPDRRNGSYTRHLSQSWAICCSVFLAPAPLALLPVYAAVPDERLLGSA